MRQLPVFKRSLAIDTALKIALPDAQHTCSTVTPVWQGPGNLLHHKGLLVQQKQLGNAGRKIVGAKKERLELIGEAEKERGLKPNKISLALTLSFFQ